MKSSHKIDQFFKEKLEHRNFVLEDVFVTDLEKKLDAQSRFAVWWKIGLSILLAGGLSLAGFYYINQQQDTSANQTTEHHTAVAEPVAEKLISTPQKIVATTDKQEPIHKEILKEKRTIEPAKTKPFIKTNNTEKPTTAPVTKALATATKNSSTRPSRSKENNTTTTTKPTNLNTKSTDMVLNENLKPKKNQQKPIETGGNTLLNSSTKLAGERDKDLISATPTANEAQVEVKKMTETTKNVSSATKNNSNSELSLEQAKNQLPIKEDTLKKTPLKDVVKPTAKKSKDKISNRWEASVFVGGVAISKSISGNESETHYTARKESEENIFSLVYGAELSCFLNPHINLSTGVHSLTYGEDAAYITSEITFKTESVISSYDSTFTQIVDSNGVTIDTTVTPIYSNQITTDTINQEVASKNRYSYAQIPFMLGYKKQWKKLGINLRAGVVYGRLVKSGGGYINAAGTAIAPTTLKKNIVNVVVSTVVSYPIKKINLFMEPRYQFNISNVFPNAATDQKYKAFGVNLGASINF